MKKENVIVISQTFLGNFLLRFTVKTVAMVLNEWIILLKWITPVCWIKYSVYIYELLHNFPSYLTIVTFPKNIYCTKLTVYNLNFSEIVIQI